MVLQKKFRITSPVQITSEFLDSTTGQVFQTYFLSITGGQTSGKKSTIGTFQHYGFPVGEANDSVNTSTFITIKSRAFVLDFNRATVIN